MMVSVSALYVGDSVILEDESNIPTRSNSARVLRVQTLDGGTTIIHSGTFDGDRTLNHTMKYKQVDESTLWAMFYDELEMVISQADGVYAGVMEYLKLESGVATFDFAVREKLSE